MEETPYWFPRWLHQEIKRCARLLPQPHQNYPAAIEYHLKTSQTQFPQLRIWNGSDACGALRIRRGISATEVPQESEGSQPRAPVLGSKAPHIWLWKWATQSLRGRWRAAGLPGDLAGLSTKAAVLQAPFLRLLAICPLQEVSHPGPAAIFSLDCFPCLRCSEKILRNVRLTACVSFWDLYGVESNPFWVYSFLYVVEGRPVSWVFYVSVVFPEHLLNRRPYSIVGSRPSVRC